MIKITNKTLLWEENERRKDTMLLVNILKLILIGATLYISMYFVDIQFSNNDKVIIINIIFQLILISSGFVLRNKLLKPNFQHAYDINNNYHQFMGIASSNMDKKYQIIGGFLGIFMLPILIIIIVFNIININGTDIFLLLSIYYPSLILGLYIHPSVSFDNGYINSEKIIINQSDGGNYYSIDVPTKFIDKIGIYLEPKLFYYPEKITLMISLDKGYYCEANLSSNKQEPIIKQIDKIHKWLENVLKIKLIVYKSYEEWNNEKENRLEIKMLI